MLHNYKLRQFHRTSSGENPSSGFKDMRSEKSGTSSLQWLHNERVGVSNHQPHDCFTQPFIQGADQRKHQSPAWLGFLRGIHRRPVNSPHKEPVTRKMFPFDDVIMRLPGRLAAVLLTIDQFHKSQNAPVPYPTMLYSETEMCIFLFWVDHCGVWNKCIRGFVN